MKTTLGSTTYLFADLKELLAKASPLRSADELAGLAATTELERVAARYALADVPLAKFLEEPLVPYDEDEVTRLIHDSHDALAFAPICSLTVGEFREWLLAPTTGIEELERARRGITPEMAAAVSKLMRLQDLIAVAKKCVVVTKFRTTVGLAGRISTRLQPNHPTDNIHGIIASTLDGLLLGSGDAVIGINPATDNVNTTIALLKMIDDLRQRYEIPTQSCVLAHLTTTRDALEQQAPVDLVFQSIAGSQKANTSFGVDLKLIGDVKAEAEKLDRGTIGKNIMYFETGQGAALSADAHHGVDAQTMESRAYAVARHFDPFLINSVVGFIGPEYLYNGKQYIVVAISGAAYTGELLAFKLP